jgi:hypothetical protein
MTEQKELEDVQYCNYLRNNTTNYARCTQTFESRIAMAKAAFNRKKALFTSRLGLDLRKKVVKWIEFHGAETWTLRKVDQKYLEIFLKCGAGEKWRRSAGPIT